MTEIKTLHFNGYKTLPKVIPEGELPVEMLAQAGDLIFVRSNGNPALVGRVTLLGGVPGRITHSGFTIRGRPDQSKVVPAFLAYWLAGDSTRQAIKRLTGGTNITNLSQAILARLPVSLPPLNEQQSMLRVLEQLEAAPRIAATLVHAKRRFKRGLMQGLLTGKRRFTEFDGDKGRLETRFGTLPESWRYPCMEEIGLEVSERAGEASHDAVVLSCSKHAGLVESIGYFGRQVFSDDRTNYKVVRRGQFAYPSNHLEEGSIGLLAEHPIGLVSPIYTVFAVSDEVVPEFLYLVFKTNEYRRLFAASTNASVNRRGSVRWSGFRNLHVPLPPVSEQLCIVELSKQLNGEIQLLERLHAVLGCQRRGIAELLLTGKVRIPA